MKKVWNFIFKYRVYVLIFIILIFGVIIFFSAKTYLYPDDQKTVYGSRLDGIEDVKITSQRITEIVDIIKEEDGIKEASIDIQGKTVNISIIVEAKDNTIDEMKEFSTRILSNFTETEIAFYDFQFFINNEAGNYNMIGYKNKKNSDITWTTDEIVSEVESNEEDQ